MFLTQATSLSSVTSLIHPRLSGLKLGVLLDPGPLRHRQLQRGRLLPGPERLPNSGIEPVVHQPAGVHLQGGAGGQWGLV